MARNTDDDDNTDGGAAFLNTDFGAHSSRTIILIPSQPDVGAQETVESSTNGDGSLFTNVCCQVEIHLLPGNRSILYSRDSNGRRKNTGGDEFFIRYEECLQNAVGDQEGHICDSESTLLLQAVALITDRNDGSYLLDFSTTPMHPDLPAERDGTVGAQNIQQFLVVYFEYTNGIGSMPPPTKKCWENGGYTHSVYRHTVRDGRHHPSTGRPKIRKFQPPTTRGIIDLGRFDQVFAFGDSTFCQFVRQRPNKNGKYYFRRNLRVGEKVRVGLNSLTISILLGLLDQEMGDFLSCAGSKTGETTTPTKKALIVGSCLWDILDFDNTQQGSEYRDHAEACRSYVACIRKRYPSVTVIWKSPMAVHIHWVDLERVVEHDRAAPALFGINRIKYMSGSRSRFLNDLQKRIMAELDVPFLDLYEATYLSADCLYPSDGRHYKPDLNRRMLGWFYGSDDDGTVNSRNDGDKFFQQVV